MEEVDSDYDGGYVEWGFRAICLATGAVCDAWSYPYKRGILKPGEGAAIERALTYLGDRTLHEKGSPRACYAEHFIDNGGRRK